MVGKSLFKKRHYNASVPGAARQKKGSESKKKGGSGLADLHEEDKAKVARLINQVISAFREVQGLKELLEVERKSHESTVTKLRQQNCEVAAEVSQLRLKLASQQLDCPLQPQKVILQTARHPPSLCPIKEAEGFNDEAEAIQHQPTGSDTQVKRILGTRKNMGSSTTNGWGLNKCEETMDENEKVGSQTASAQPDVPHYRGKENKDPDVPPLLSSKCVVHMTSQLPKRPSPRPLPSLLNTILHCPENLGYMPFPDCSPCVGKCVPEPSDSGSASPTMDGQSELQSVSTKPSKLHDESTNPQVSVTNLVNDHTSSNKELEIELFNGEARDHFGCGAHSQCLQDDVSDALPIIQQIKTPNGMNLDCQRCQGLCCTRQRSCAGSGAPDCLQISQASLDSEEHLGRSKKISTNEDLHGPRTPASQRLRFGPIDGEEGVFYYPAGLELVGRQNTDKGSSSTEEETRGHVKAVTGRSSSVFFPEERSLNRDNEESHWAPMAIERENSFRTIPVMFTKFSRENDNIADGRNGSDTGFFAKGSSKPQTRAEGATGNFEMLLESESELEVHPKMLSESDTEPVSFNTDIVDAPSFRRTSQRQSFPFMRKCFRCAAIVRPKLSQPRSVKSVTKKDVVRCPDCSSLLKPISTLRRRRDAAAHRESTTRCVRCSSVVKRKPPNHPSWTLDIEEKSCSTGAETNASDSSTLPGVTGRARCLKCSTLSDSKLSRLRLLKTRRRQHGMKRWIREEDEHSESEGVMCCAASEELQLSTSSSIGYSSRSSPSFDFKVCGVNSRKVKKSHRSGNRRDHRADPTTGVSDVNHVFVEELPESERTYDNEESLRSSRVDATENRVQTRQNVRSHKCSYKDSLEESLKKKSEAKASDVAMEGAVKESPPRVTYSNNTDWEEEISRSPSWRGESSPQKYCHAHRVKQSSSESWRKMFDVDVLLSRFIESNAECAAELIKCSIYFESTAPRPASQNSMMSSNDTTGCIVSHVRLQPRRELFHLNDSIIASRKSCPGHLEPQQCTTYTIAESEPVEPAVRATNLDEKGQTGNANCSLSATAQEGKLKGYADHGQEVSRPGCSLVPPIVLPRIQTTEPFYDHEVGGPEKTVMPPSQMLRRRSGNWASTEQWNPEDSPNENQRVPIVTGVLVGSRSTLGGVGENVTSHTNMFDISLYHLVNDIEGQRRDYWTRLNNQRVLQDQTQNRNVRPKEGKVMDKEQRFAGTRRIFQKRQLPRRHFR